MGSSHTYVTRALTNRPSLIVSFYCYQLHRSHACWQCLQPRVSRRDSSPVCCHTRMAVPSSSSIKPDSGHTRKPEPVAWRAKRDG